MYISYSRSSLCIINLNIYIDNPHFIKLYTGKYFLIISNKYNLFVYVNYLRLTESNKFFELFNIDPKQHSFEYSSLSSKILYLTNLIDTYNASKSTSVNYNSYF